MILSTQVRTQVFASVGGSQFGNRFVFDLANAFPGEVEFFTNIFKAHRVGHTYPEVQLYHIALEATTNAAKHAHPNKIDIELAQKGQRLTLAVSDDGKGFPEKLPEPPGLGLRLMAHGAALIGGKFSVQRNRNGGTVVICKLNAD